jgi:hypothetical protein
MLIWISDFDMAGSGYMNISTRLVNELVLNYHIGVICLGLNYKGDPHPWPYSIVPVQKFSDLPRILQMINQ